MASSAAAIAVKEVLVVAVFVVLLFHSSAGHHPHKPPRHARPHCHSTGPSPSPSPLPPAPTPTLLVPVVAPPPTLPPPPPPVPTTPTPSPAPAPVNCSAIDCASRCTPICQANHDAGVAKCKSDFDTSLNVCHDQCTSYACPGGSCVNSGCQCPCDNANATRCCDACGGGAYSQYQTCSNSYDKGFGYCMMDCENTCYKNCTQGV